MCTHTIAWARTYDGDHQLLNVDGALDATALARHAIDEMGERAGDIVECRATVVENGTCGEMFEADYELLAAFADAVIAAEDLDHEARVAHWEEHAEFGYEYT